ncbi:hypothetical protein F5890DRAFT_1538169 [Lentinula detonsa]|uniref:Uncharacterized protein n=1 Tax=Lentinula detonsa TaxID=2804962 RepID=A0AA38PTL1_9AGAR|nr:hypothetical protein F5890DRAFT_1538169 [Lentinula detonsa]
MSYIARSQWDAIKDLRKLNPSSLQILSKHNQPARFHTRILAMKFFTIISAVLIAAISVTSVSAAADIAADPDSACRCPNNCSHKFGDSCKFYDNGNVISGSCVNGNGGLTCAT